MAKFKIELQLKSTEENSPRILLTDFDSNNENNSGITFEETLIEEENDLYTLDFQIPHILENGLEVGSLIKVGRVLWLTLQDDRVIKMIITNFSIDEGDENWVYLVSAKDYASYVFAKTSVGLELDTFTDEDFWDWMEQKEFKFTTVENIGKYILDRSFLRDDDGSGWEVIDEGAFKAWDLDDYQLVVHGDLTFDNDNDGIPDGYPNGYTLIDATANSLVDGVFTFTATEQNGRFNYILNPGIIDTYYAFASVKANSSSVFLYGLLNNTMGISSHSGSNVYELLSIIGVPNGNNDNLQVRDSRTTGFTPISVDYMGAFNISQMRLNGIKDDNGVLFSVLTDEQIQIQLDTWVQKNIKIIGSIYNISVSNSNLYNALVELANISNRTFKIDYTEKQIIFYGKDDEIYDKNYQLVDKLNIQDSSLSYNGEELYGLFYVLGGTNLEDSYVFLQDETEYKDSFIYDFSYFKDAGLLSQEDIEDINGIFGIADYPIPEFWGSRRTLKQINEELQSVVGTLDTLESNLSLMEGRIKNHIVNALADGNITKEELQQVDAFFEYWAQQEEEFKIEIKSIPFGSYDWSVEPINTGPESNRDEPDDSLYIRWTIPDLSGASFRYVNEIKTFGVAGQQGSLTFEHGSHTYEIEFSTTSTNFSPILYDGREKNGSPNLYYRIIGDDAMFQPHLLQVISTPMIKTYKIVHPIFKRTMPYFELLYQINGNDLIARKRDEINKEIEEYEKLWIQDQKELELESVKTENKDENKIATLTERIKGYRLAIGEHRFDFQSETLTPIKEQPGWITTLKRIYGDFLPKWEANFESFREKTPELRIQKRRLLKEKQNFWYTLKEKYGRSTFAEGYYENELELNSKDLMNQAKAIYESHKKPTEDFSITYIDISDIIGLNIDQIKVGDFIKIKKDKYNIQTNNYSKIKVSSISRTLREDANIQLTINRVNLLDKLLEKIIATSQQ